MKFFFSDSRPIPLPEGHRFPGSKYTLLRNRLLEEGILRGDDLEPSPLCERADLEAVHSPEYVHAVFAGTLTQLEQRQIGLPWSEQLLLRSRAVMGGAVAGVQCALQDGFCAQLSGGTHHAHRDGGSGYCVFNDFAVASAKALCNGWAARIAVIDLDVHQGDGNAAMLSAMDSVFTLDVYCEKNFPFRKITPNLGVPLKAGIGDADYLAALSDVLPAIIAFRPSLVLYQAGVDPLCHDSLGHLDLSYEGLVARDRLVFEMCKREGFPLFVAIGGGYSKPISLSVEAYVNTFRMAKAVFGF